MNDSKLLSHDPLNEASLAKHLQEIEERILQREDLNNDEIAKRIKLLKDLSEFRLGRFLIANNGLNGFWTDYIVKHPSKGRLSGLNIDGFPLSELENFLLNKAPSVLATQERFQIFQNLLQAEVHSGKTMASVPCGLMSDLLLLDFRNIDEIKLLGIDLDKETIELAREQACQIGMLDKVYLMEADALSLDCENAFDILTSNGLNIYISSNENSIRLYKNFYKALKPQGKLVTSFLTYPPVSSVSCWDMSKIDSADLCLQNIIFKEVLNVQWLCFCSRDEIKEQLTKVGFSQVEFIFDRAKIFPTVTAIKQFC